jgi:hypothetical protein
LVTIKSQITMKKTFLAAALLAVSTCGFAQDVNKLINQDDVARIIKTLSADDMQGRATFTPGIEKAAKFIEGEYTKAGLVPLTGNSSFRQNFTMVRTKPVKLTVSINGKSIAADSAFTTGGESFSWATNADVQVVQVTADKNFRQEYGAITKSGKKTLVLVDPKFKDLFSRMWSFNNRGSMSFKGKTATPVVFVLGRLDAVTAFDVNYESKTEELPLFNVAGMIPGKTKPEEFVVFSGHYSIANGADDDASGTTAVLTLAKYYKKLNNNARTLIFVAFTAEEIGEYGSQYFATQVAPDKVTAMFNIEMIGKASKFGTNSAFITGYERSDFGKILQKNLEKTTFKFYPDPYPEQDLFYRSDNASLAEVGVPAHTISTDQIDIDKLYHTVKDEFSSLDVNNITSTIRAIALSSRSIVAGTDTPTRVPKLER